MPAVKEPPDKFNIADRNPGDTNYKHQVERFEGEGAPSKADTNNFKLDYGDEEDEASASAQQAQELEESPDNTARVGDDIDEQESRGDVNYKNNVSVSGGAKQVSPIQRIKQKRNTILVTAAIMTGTFGFIGIITGPAGLLVQLKERLVSKFGDRLQSLQQVRTSRIVLKSLGGDPFTAGCGTVKVKCRYKGMSKRQAAKFERRNPGSKIVLSDEKNAIGKRRVKGIQFTDDKGKQRFVQLGSFKEYVVKDANFRKLILNYNKTKVAHWRDKTAGKVYTKLKLSLAKVRAPRGPPQTEEEMKKKIAADREAGKARRAALAFKYRGIIRKADIISTLCAIKSLVKIGKNAIKVTLAAQVAAFAFKFVNAADDIKNGTATGDSGTIDNISNLATQLTTKDENGKTFADSASYQYMSDGVIVKDKGNQADYQLGVGPEKGLLGQVSNASKDVPILSEVSYVANIVLNPVVCTVGGVVSLVGCFLTGGIGCIASTAAVGALVYVAMPIILKDFIKSPDVETSQGGNAGDATVTGFSHIAKTNNQHRGSIPQTVDQAITNDKFSDNAQAGGNYPSLAEALDPHEPNSFTGKLATTFLPSAIRVSASVSSLPTTLAGLLGNSMSKVAVDGAQARSVIPGEYEQCNDADYEEMDIAADPLCVPQYGLDPRMVLGDTDYNKEVAYATPEKPEPEGFSFASLFEAPTAHAANSPNDTRGFVPDNRFDAEKVVDYMVDGSKPWIDDNGEGIDYSSPDPDADKDYPNYVKECLETLDPLEPNSPDMCKPKQCVEASSGSEEFRYCMFSQYTLDTGILDQLEDRDASNNTNPEGELETETESVTGGIPSGSAQELAKQIIDSGQVTAEGGYFTQIKDIADRKPGCYVSPKILGFILAMSKKYKLNISSLNRRCTGLLTPSGTGSLHYAGEGGRAVDINYVDGIQLTYQGAAKQKAEDYFNDAAKILPKNAELGQINSCNLTVDTQGITDIVGDPCNHAHVGIP